MPTEQQKEEVKRKVSNFSNNYKKYKKFQKKMTLLKEKSCYNLLSKIFKHLDSYLGYADGKAILENLESLNEDVLQKMSMIMVVDCLSDTSTKTKEILSKITIDNLEDFKSCINNEKTKRAKQADNKESIIKEFYKNELYQKLNYDFHKIQIIQSYSEVLKEESLLNFATAMANLTDNELINFLEMQKKGSKNSVSVVVNPNFIKLSKGFIAKAEKGLVNHIVAQNKIDFEKLNEVHAKLWNEVYKENFINLKVEDINKLFEEPYISFVNEMMNKTKPDEIKPGFIKKQYKKLEDILVKFPRLSASDVQKIFSNSHIHKWNIEELGEVDVTKAVFLLSSCDYDKYLGLDEFQKKMVLEYEILPKALEGLSDSENIYKFINDKKEKISITDIDGKYVRAISDLVSKGREILLDDMEKISLTVVNYLNGFNEDEVVILKKIKNKELCRQIISQKKAKEFFDLKDMLNETEKGKQILEKIYEDPKLIEHLSASDILDFTKEFTRREKYIMKKMGVESNIDLIGLVVNKKLRKNKKSILSGISRSGLNIDVTQVSLEQEHGVEVSYLKDAKDNKFTKVHYDINMISFFDYKEEKEKNKVRVNAFVNINDINESQFPEGILFKNNHNIDKFVGQFDGLTREAFEVINNNKEIFDGGLSVSKLYNLKFRVVKKQENGIEKYYLDFNGDGKLLNKLGAKELTTEAAINSRVDSLLHTDFKGVGEKTHGRKKWLKIMLANHINNVGGISNEDFDKAVIQFNEIVEKFYEQGVNFDDVYLNVAPPYDKNIFNLLDKLNDILGSAAKPLEALEKIEGADLTKYGYQHLMGYQGVVHMDKVLVNNREDGAYDVQELNPNNKGIELFREALVKKLSIDEGVVDIDEKINKILSLVKQSSNTPQDFKFLNDDKLNKEVILFLSEMVLKQESYKDYKMVDFFDNLSKVIKSISGNEEKLNFFMRFIRNVEIKNDSEFYNIGNCVNFLEEVFKVTGLNLNKISDEQVKLLMDNFNHRQENGERVRVSVFIKNIVKDKELFEILKKNDLLDLGQVLYADRACIKFLKERMAKEEDKEFIPVILKAVKKNKAIKLNKVINKFAKIKLEMSKVPEEDREKNIEELIGKVLKVDLEAAHSLEKGFGALEGYVDYYFRKNVHENFSGLEGIVSKLKEKKQESPESRKIKVSTLRIKVILSLFGGPKVSGLTASIPKKVYKGIGFDQGDIILDAIKDADMLDLLSSPSFMVNFYHDVKTIGDEEFLKKPLKEKIDLFLNVEGINLKDYFGFSEANMKKYEEEARQNGGVDKLDLYFNNLYKEVSELIESKRKLRLLTVSKNIGDENIPSIEKKRAVFLKILKERKKDPIFEKDYKVVLESMNKSQALEFMRLFHQLIEKLHRPEEGEGISNPSYQKGYSKILNGIKEHIVFSEKDKENIFDFIYEKADFEEIYFGGKHKSDLLKSEYQKIKSNKEQVKKFFIDNFDKLVNQPPESLSDRKANEFFEEALDSLKIFPLDVENFHHLLFEKNDIGISNFELFYSKLLKENKRIRDKYNEVKGEKEKFKQFLIENNEYLVNADNYFSILSSVNDIYYQAKHMAAKGAIMLGQQEGREEFFDFLTDIENFEKVFFRVLVENEKLRNKFLERKNNNDFEPESFLIENYKEIVKEISKLTGDKNFESAMNRMEPDYKEKRVKEFLMQEFVGLFSEEEMQEFVKDALQDVEPKKPGYFCSEEQFNVSEQELINKIKGENRKSSKAGRVSKQGALEEEVLTFIQKMQESVGQKDKPVVFSFGTINKILDSQSKEDLLSNDFLQNEVFLKLKKIVGQAVKRNSALAKIASSLIDGLDKALIDVFLKIKPIILRDVEKISQMYALSMSLNRMYNLLVSDEIFTLDEILQMQNDKNLTSNKLKRIINRKLSDYPEFQEKYKPFVEQALTHGEMNISQEGLYSETGKSVAKMVQDIDSYVDKGLIENFASSYGGFTSQGIKLAVKSLDGKQKIKDLISSEVGGFFQPGSIFSRIYTEKMVSGFITNTKHLESVKILIGQYHAVVGCYEFLDWNNYEKNSGKVKEFLYFNDMILNFAKFIQEYEENENFHPIRKSAEGSIYKIISSLSKDVHLNEYKYKEAMQVIEERNKLLSTISKVEENYKKDKKELYYRVIANSKIKEFFIKGKNLEEFLKLYSSSANVLELAELALEYPNELELLNEILLNKDKLEDNAVKEAFFKSGDKKEFLRRILFGKKVDEFERIRHYEKEDYNFFSQLMFVNEKSGNKDLIDWFVGEYKEQNSFFVKMKLNLARVHYKEMEKVYKKQKQEGKSFEFIQIDKEKWPALLIVATKAADNELMERLQKSMEEPDYNQYLDAYNKTTPEEVEKTKKAWAPISLDDSLRGVKDVMLEYKGYGKGNRYHQVRLQSLKDKVKFIDELHFGGGFVLDDGKSKVSICELSNSELSKQISEYSEALFQLSQEQPEPEGLAQTEVVLLALLVEHGRRATAPKNIILNHSQIISILNDLSRGGKGYTIHPTGQGKSIMIQVRNTLFALKGNDMFIGTKNEMLVEEAYDPFLTMYDAAGVQVEHMTQDSKPVMQGKKGKVRVGTMSNVAFFLEKIKENGLQVDKSKMGLTIDEFDEFVFESSSLYQQSSLMNLLKNDDKREYFIEKMYDILENRKGKFEVNSNIYQSKNDIIMALKEDGILNAVDINDLDKLNDIYWELLFSSFDESLKLQKDKHFKVVETEGGLLAAPLIGNEISLDSKFLYFSHQFLHHRLNKELNGKNKKSSKEKNDEKKFKITKFTKPGFSMSDLDVINYFAEQGLIMGLSGTYGNADLLDDAVIEFASHQGKVRKDRKPRFYYGSEQHLAAVVASVKESIEKNQPIVLFEKDIKGAEALKKALQDAGICFQIDIAGETHDENNNSLTTQEIVERAGEPQRVTIFTPQHQRGTDIAPKNKMLGLNVKEIYEDAADATEMQQLGRAGRAGMVGDTDRIFNLDSILMERKFKEITAQGISLNGVGEGSIKITATIGSVMISIGDETFTSRISSGNIDDTWGCDKAAKIDAINQAYQYLVEQKRLKHEDVSDGVVNKQIAKIRKEEEKYDLADSKLYKLQKMKWLLELKELMGMSAENKDITKIDKIKTGFKEDLSDINKVESEINKLQKEVFKKVKPLDKLPKIIDKEMKKQVKLMEKSDKKLDKLNENFNRYRNEFLQERAEIKDKNNIHKDVKDQVKKQVQGYFGAQIEFIRKMIYMQTEKQLEDLDEFSPEMQRFVQERERILLNNNTYVAKVDSLMEEAREEYDKLNPNEDLSTKQKIQLSKRRRQEFYERYVQKNIFEYDEKLLKEQGEEAYKQKYPEDKESNPYHVKRKDEFLGKYIKENDYSLLDAMEHEMQSDYDIWVDNGQFNVNNPEDFMKTILANDDLNSNRKVVVLYDGGKKAVVITNGEFILDKSGNIKIVNVKGSDYISKITKKPGLFEVTGDNFVAKEEVLFDVFDGLKFANKGNVVKKVNKRIKKDFLFSRNTSQEYESAPRVKYKLEDRINEKIEKLKGEKYNSLVDVNKMDDNQFYQEHEKELKVDKSMKKKANLLLSGLQSELSSEDNINRYMKKLAQQAKDMQELMILINEHKLLNGEKSNYNVDALKASLRTNIESIVREFSSRGRELLAAKDGVRSDLVSLKQNQKLVKSFLSFMSQIDSMKANGLIEDTDLSTLENLKSLNKSDKSQEIRDLLSLEGPGDVIQQADKKFEQDRDSVIGISRLKQIGVDVKPEDTIEGVKKKIIKKIKKRTWFNNTRVQKYLKRVKGDQFNKKNADSLADEILEEFSILGRPGDKAVKVENLEEMKVKYRDYLELKKVHLNNQKNIEYVPVVREHVFKNFMLDFNNADLEKQKQVYGYIMDNAAEEKNEFKEFFNQAKVEVEKNYPGIEAKEGINKEIGLAQVFEPPKPKSKPTVVKS